MSALVSLYFFTLSSLAPLLSCAAIGVYWARRKLPFSANFLSVLVTSVSTPALVFITLYSTALDNQTMLEIGFATIASLLTAMMLCALALKLMHLPVRNLLQTAAFPNAGNLGLPLAQVAFGDDGLSAAVVFFAICAFMQNTIGVRTLPVRGSKVSGWRSPVLIASVLAVTLRLLDIPLMDWIIESVTLVGSLTVPLMLISLGYGLSNIPSRGLRAGSAVASLRLILGGLSAWLVTTILGLNEMLSSLIVLQMTMPCAVLSYIFAVRYTDNSEISAGAVLISTVAFLLLSPLILVLVGARPTF